jgi:hypothetical protein
MKISNTHKKFARRLNPKDALNYPGDYLGPNWEEVINFWLYLDTLSKKQSISVLKRWRTLSDKEKRIANGKAWYAARATTRYASWASSAVCDVVCYMNHAAEYATFEIIGLEKLLEQGHQPLFFPMFLNL